MTNWFRKLLILSIVIHYVFPASAGQEAEQPSPSNPSPSPQQNVSVTPPSTGAKGDPFANDFFNNSQKWGTTLQPTNQIPQQPSPPPSTQNPTNSPPVEVNIPPEAITQVEAKATPDGSPTSSNTAPVTVDPSAQRKPQNQPSPPAPQPAAPTQPSPPPSPIINNSPQSIVAPSNQIVNTPLGSAATSTATVEQPQNVKSTTAPQPAADSQNNIQQMIDLRGKGAVDSAKPGIDPKQSATVTNLSPNSVAAPQQSLPKASDAKESPKGIEGAITILKDKIHNIENNQKNAPTPNSDAGDVAPVIIDESTYKAQAPEVDEALSLIFKDDSKLDRKAKIKKSTRPVYDHTPNQQITATGKKFKAPPTKPISAERVAYLSSNLYLAISSSNLGAVQSLLDSGADINSKTADFGLTPLMLAVSANDSRTTRYLAVRGADVNAQAADGSTALKLAAVNGNLEIVHTLIEFNADFMKRDDNGKFPFDYLPQDLRDQAVLSIAKTCKDLNKCLMEATLFGSPAAANLALKRGADANYKDDRGETPLIIASRIGYFDVINLLLTNGADPRITNSNGKKAFDFAQARGDSQTALILETMATKLDLDEVTIPGQPQTPKHKAKAKGSAHKPNSKHYHKHEAAKAN